MIIIVLAVTKKFQISFWSTKIPVSSFKILGSHVATRESRTLQMIPCSMTVLTLNVRSREFREAGSTRLATLGVCKLDPEVAQAGTVIWEKS